MSKYLLFRTNSSFVCSFDNSQLNWFGTYLAGGFGGAFAWSLAFPMDTIKSRIQISPNNSSIHQVFSEIFKASGWRGFYRGWTAAVLRAFPANAGLILGYESVLKLLKS